MRVGERRNASESSQRDIMPRDYIIIACFGAFRLDKFITFGIKVSKTSQSEGLFESMK